MKLTTLARININARLNNVSHGRRSDLKVHVTFDAIRGGRSQNRSLAGH